MRKKSHISMADQIIESLQIEPLTSHRMAFRIGNILPDCQPSFLTTRHSYDETIEATKEKMRQFIDEYNSMEEIGSRVCIKLGEIIHYIADYFTFPHNKHYAGNMKDHCLYESDLKHQLREFVHSEAAEHVRTRVKRFDSLEELFSFIQKIHAWYMRKPRNIYDDCKFAVYVCTSVVATIFHILAKRYETQRTWNYTYATVS